VLTSAPIWALWGERFCASFREPPTALFLPPGEKYKTMASVERLAREMLRAGADRGSLLIAFGANDLSAQTNKGMEQDKNKDREKERKELITEIGQKDKEIYDEITNKQLSFFELGQDGKRFVNKKTGDEIYFGDCFSQQWDDPESSLFHNIPESYIDVKGEWKGEKVRFLYVDRCSSQQLGQVDRFILIKEKKPSPDKQEAIDDLYQITFDDEASLQDKVGSGKKMKIFDFKNINTKPFYMVYDLEEKGFYGKDGNEDTAYELWSVIQKKYLQDLTNFLKDLRESE